VNVSQTEKLDEGPGGEIDLHDQPGKLTPQEFSVLLKELWEKTEPGAKVNMCLPHPSHQRAKSYANSLWPEDLHHLLHTLGLKYSDAEVGLELSPEWQSRLDSGEKTADEIASEAQRTPGVIEWIHIELKIDKASQSQPLSGLVTHEMRVQLLEQYQNHVNRGNKEAAETVHRLLAALNNG
jgi:hypothetical protein